MTDKDLLLNNVIISSFDSIIYMTLYNFMMWSSSICVTLDVQGRTFLNELESWCFCMGEVFWPS
jgi:hypothetical protein